MIPDNTIFKVNDPRVGFYSMPGRPVLIKDVKPILTDLRPLCLGVVLQCVVSLCDSREE